MKKLKNVKLRIKGSTIPELYRFSNKNFIFRNNKIILPTSLEGQRIEKILKIQKKNHELNLTQKRFFEQITSAKNSAIAIDILIKGANVANTKRPTHLSKYKFSNGNYFARDGMIVNPKFDEGKIIEDIILRTNQDREINKEHKKEFKKISQISSMNEAIEYLLQKNNQTSKSVLVKGTHLRRSSKTRQKLKAQPKSMMNLKRKKMLGMRKISKKKITKKDYVVMRLKKVKIIDIKTRFSKKASILVVSAVYDGRKNQKNPVSIKHKPFNDIKEGENLTIGRFGVSMYQKHGKIPFSLTPNLLVYKSNKGFRNVGDTITKIQNNKEFITSASTINSLLSADPLSSVIVHSIISIAGIIGKFLKVKKDDQLLFFEDTLIHPVDGFNHKEIQEGNKYVKFSYSVETGKY